MSDESTRRLTHDELARLRPSVVVAALERLIAYLPVEGRSAVLLTFYSAPTPAETIDALRASGVSDTELEELRRTAEYSPLPPHLAHPENDSDPNWVAPTWTMGLSSRPPDDPELRALWEAVEPRRGAA